MTATDNFFSTLIPVDNISQTTSESPDIANWFIRDFESGKSPDTDLSRQNLLLGNAVSVIVGGRQVFTRFLVQAVPNVTSRFLGC